MKFKIKRTMVYLTIVNDLDELICFMGISEFDLKYAEIICKALNELDDIDVPQWDPPVRRELK